MMSVLGSLITSEPNRTLTMRNSVESILHDLYESMLQNGMIHFPPKEIINNWELILNQWMNVSHLPLFVRQPSKIRGSDIKHVSGRSIIITDNTPAHWVYKTFVFDNKPVTLTLVEEAMNSKSLPLAMMRKRTELDFLHKTQIASKDFRLGNVDWKISHIKGVALPRTLKLQLQEYQKHHYRFLSLGNMYLIRKEYSGLAEVKAFNDIITLKRRI